MPRLFVAIKIPAETGQILALKKGKLKGARWVEAENYHITLTFLGDIDLSLADEVRLELDEIRQSGFRVRIEGMDVFGSARKPRTLFASVDQSPELMGLQDRVDYSMRRIGVETEQRKYTPHVTLARLSGARHADVAQYLMLNGVLPALEFDVDEFQLFSSRESRGGGPYLIEQEYPLADHWKHDEVQPDDQRQPQVP